MNAHNTFEKPEVVRAIVFDDFTLGDNKLNIKMPLKSIAVFELREEN
jgi:alpha-L-arabinofuranosidase